MSVGESAMIKALSYSDKLVDKETSFILNGLGVRTYAFVDVYASALYLVEKTSDESKILNSNSLKILKMHYFRSISKEDLVKVWEVALKENGAGPADKSSVEQFNKAVINVKDGTEISYLFSPNYLEIRNPDSTVKIERVGFAKILLSTWIGPNPPTSALKKGLLGK